MQVTHSDFVDKLADFIERRQAVRTQNALTRGQIITTEQLTQTPDSALLKLNNFGKTSLRAIRNAFGNGPPEDPRTLIDSRRRRPLDNIDGCERILNTVIRMTQDDKDLAIYVAVSPKRAIIARITTKEQVAEVERTLGITA